MAPGDDGSISMAGPADGGGRISFRVQWRIALVLWLLMAAWLAVLMAFTWLFWRDGPPAQLGAIGWVLLAVFWIAGLAAGVWASSFAMVSLRIDGEAVEVSERQPFKVRTTRCRVSEIGVPAIVDGIDDEGDPTFRCEVRLPDGRAVNLAESHRRPEVETVRRRILVAMALHSPR